MRKLLLLAASALAACATQPSESATSSADVSALSPAHKSAEVQALDAMVTAINGTASVDAWNVEHPRDFEDDLDTSRLADARCTATGVVESSTRWITRDRATARIRKLGLTWSGWRGDVSTTHHETYHYDASGRLRVVVVDVEDEHMLDDAYMANVTAHDEQIRREAQAIPLDSEEHKVEAAQKARDLEDSTTVTQIRIYFSESGERIYETMRPGLERARKLDYGDVDDTPPVLYGDIHPANVTARPVLEHLFPSPMYRFEPLPEYEVPADQSALHDLVASAPKDAEASLSAPTVCR
jgi:hypothetical protein